MEESTREVVRCLQFVCLPQKSSTRATRQLSTAGHNVQFSVDKMSKNVLITRTSPDVQEKDHACLEVCPSSWQSSAQNIYFLQTCPVVRAFVHLNASPTRWLVRQDLMATIAKSLTFACQFHVRTWQLWLRLKILKVFSVETGKNGLRCPQFCPPLNCSGQGQWSSGELDPLTGCRGEPKCI